MKKTLICILLTVCMVLGNAMVSLAAPAESRSFRDVHSDDWYYEACEYVYQHGYMIGTGDQMFSPDSSVTYAMAVQVLANLTEGVDLQMTEGMTQWYQLAIRWAERTGLEDGWKYADRFDENPDTELTRRAFAKLIYQYAIMTECDLSVSVSRNDEQRQYLTQIYQDISEDNLWGSTNPTERDALIWCYEHGIIKGYEDGGVHLFDTFTRAQLAQILYNMKDVFQNHRLTALCHFNPEKVTQINLASFYSGAGTVYSSEDDIRPITGLLNTVRIDPEYETVSVTEYEKNNIVSFIISPLRFDPDNKYPGGACDIIGLSISEEYVWFSLSKNDDDIGYARYQVTNPEVTEELFALLYNKNADSLTQAQTEEVKS